MKRIFIFLILLIAGLYFQSCKKSEITSKEIKYTVPPEIENPEIQNIPGGAIITYSLPEGVRFPYVKAEYTTNKGVKKVVKTTSTVNEIKIEGLSDDEPLDVDVYVVGISELESKPKKVSTHPLKPPYLNIFDSLKLSPGLSGVKVSYKNPNNIKFSIHLLKVDELGKPEEADSFKSSEAKGSHDFKEYPSVETKFGVYVIDQWGNVSDTLLKELTPIYEYKEYKLDKSKFESYPLPGDGILADSWNSAIGNIWNGKWSNDFSDPYGGNGNGWLMLLVQNPTSDPSHPTWFTFDLGETAKLSRFRLNHYLPYTGEAPRKYEVWGAVNPNPDGSWDGWTKLVEYEQIKPSGKPSGQETPADGKSWENGDQANFDSSIPDVRYIRIKCTENWQGSTDLIFEEITFWGLK